MRVALSALASFALAPYAGVLNARHLSNDCPMLHDLGPGGVKLSRLNHPSAQLGKDWHTPEVPDR
jgi:hypothetical protein